MISDSSAYANSKVLVKTSASTSCQQCVTLSDLAREALSSITIPTLVKEPADRPRQLFLGRITSVQVDAGTDQAMRAAASGLSLAVARHDKRTP